MLYCPQAKLRFHDYAEDRLLDLERVEVDQRARAFATTVVITIFTATKGSFCDMTAAMAKTALKKGKSIDTLYCGDM